MPPWIPQEPLLSLLKAALCFHVLWKTPHYLLFFHSPQKSCQHLDYGSSMMCLLISVLFWTRLLTLLKHKSDPISFFNPKDLPSHLRVKINVITWFMRPFRICCHSQYYTPLCLLGSGHIGLPMALLKTAGRFHLGASVMNVPSTQNAFI